MEKWGNYTDKTLKHFSVSSEKFDLLFIKALLNIKKAMSVANFKAKKLGQTRSKAIVSSCNDLLMNLNQSYYPVSIWQSGSGTQVNMNVNEVISIHAKNLQNKLDIDPYDHVNLSQSSNDTIPTALNIACHQFLQQKLFNTINKTLEELASKIQQYKNTKKLGRTHMMDALPISVSNELSSYHSMIEQNYSALKSKARTLRSLPLGGTAVGTGANTDQEVTQIALRELSCYYDCKFSQEKNLYNAIATNYPVVSISSELKNFASGLLKFANDMIILCSGPDGGINEYIHPNNEAGSSIMPGKVNPTQCESLSMVCIQVIANDFAVTLGESSGKLQLSTFRPLIIKNIFNSLNLLNDSLTMFNHFFLKGLKINKLKIKNNLENSKMIATLLTPFIGYKKAEDIVIEAKNKNCSVKEIVEQKKLLSYSQLDQIF